MNIFSSTQILTDVLGANFDMSRVFMAEQIMVNYIGKKPTEWDDKLSVATTEVYKKLERDNGIKSESVEGHSVSFSETKNIDDFLGPAMRLILDGYKDQHANSNRSRSFSLI